ncbi:MAG: 50S ribosomal protein L25/general stress protein Ctc [Bacteroidetes bacterium]|nr:MAG: 50S ribosomal protein L25/general stress protein Ctc [Bacteroidota bacterium]
MKTVEIIGFKRANLGKKAAKSLRKESMVPCVLYGGKDQVHFNVPMILFKNLVYTPKALMVDLNVEGTKYKAILQEVQFHPVNELILHADFLELNDSKQIRMDIPIKFVGAAIGLQRGGKLITKLKKASVKALPNDMPDVIEVDVTALDLGKSVRISEIPKAAYTILNSPLITIASIGIPRGLKTEESAAPAKGAAKAPAKAAPKK